jgi:flavin reductase (DIM6/NTAB) family NADH-FMN oxidoreductase RutF
MKLIDANELYQLNDNCFTLLDKDWMLVTAGTIKHYNMMTASWGGFGILWNKKVAFVFIRPQRHTYLFTENHETVTLSFFDENYRDILKICGTQSGKDINKMVLPGLTSLPTPNQNVYFAESRLYLEGRKVYADDLKPEKFLDPTIKWNYPKEDYHRMYIYEITGGGLK